MNFKLPFENPKTVIEEIANYQALIDECYLKIQSILRKETAPGFNKPERPPALYARHDGKWVEMPELDLSIKFPFPTAKELQNSMDKTCGIPKERFGMEGVSGHSDPDGVEAVDGIDNTGDINPVMTCPRCAFRGYASEIEDHNCKSIL
jgi:hypothetical protein